ncbi:MAG: transposase [Deltaproteobacteria bacterium]|nr:transposase [Deltaproteobacteria bacterium]
MDSSGFQNDIKTFLTAINNHGDGISNEIRITYIVDKITKLPIFLRITAGNIIDNSTMINTINFLATFGIEVELIIMDAGYTSSENLLELLSTKIPFMTRMPKNRKEYKNLIFQDGLDIENTGTPIAFGEKGYSEKTVPIRIGDHDLFAYIMLDYNRQNEERHNTLLKYRDDENLQNIMDKERPFFGKFVLISSTEYPIRDVLGFYYSRQTVEQIFDMAKNYAGALPLRGHTEETIRGISLVSFIATAVYSTLVQLLSDSKFSAQAAIIKMRHLRLTVYDNTRILEELTKDQKEIFRHLQLECPFSVESGTKLHKKNSFLSNLAPLKRVRGRPKGSKNRSKAGCSSGPDSSPQGLRPRRGRPKGSKNRPKASPPNDLNRPVASPASLTNEPDSHSEKSAGAVTPSGPPAEAVTPSVPSAEAVTPSGPPAEAVTPSDLVTMVVPPRVLPVAADFSVGLFPTADGLPKKRGRPLGSKNKPKTNPSNGLTHSADSPSGLAPHGVAFRRKRGRPLGSKNRPR